ncbi:MAG: helix-turn-helix domain-containing protein [Deltaproteobacteria bacterium]|nr:MAG: helix-turn-helix domain-containing protein [Deltaproteobacteria bacterium]
MESFGQYLRRERELRNISLEEIAEITKISKASLQAIEEDKFDLLPGKLFIRGFIRAYCRHIGLDEDDVILRFQTYWEEFCEPDVQQEKKRWSAWGVSLIVILILCLGGFLLFWVKETERESVPLLPVTEEEVVSEEVEEEQIPHSFEVPEISPPAVLTSVKPSLAEQGETVPSGIVFGKSQDTLQQDQKEGEEKKTIVLEARASEETWVRIEIDDQPPKEITLRPGESITWKATHGYGLIIGNAGGLELLLEGEKLDSLGPSGKVVVLNLP